MACKRSWVRVPSPPQISPIQRLIGNGLGQRCLIFSYDRPGAKLGVTITGQESSNRSRFITLSHATTKSRTNTS